MRSRRTSIFALVVYAAFVRSMPADAADRIAVPADVAARASAPTDCRGVPEPARWNDAGLADGGPADAIVSAHRGGNDLAPENTIAAYRHAFAYGVEMVEADVRTTADGVFVIMHDDTVDRTTNGTGAVADLKFAQIRALDAADYPPWKGTAYAGEKVPTLEEVVTLAAQFGRGVEFDIKAGDPLAIADVAARHGILAESAFNTADPRVRQVYPEARIIYNRDEFEPPASLYALATGDLAQVFGSRRDEYSAESITAIHDACGVVIPHAYDSGAAKEADELRLIRAMGGDGAQVNQPEVAAAALGEKVGTRIIRSGDRPTILPVKSSEVLVHGGVRQGIARVPGGWILTSESSILRVDEDLVPIAVNADAIPAGLRDLGYDHVGDPDQQDGRLYVPLEQPDYSRDVQLVAVYDAMTLEFIEEFPVELAHAAWLSVNGGVAWSMDEFTGDELVQFRVSDWKPIRRLKLERALSRVQGGDVGPDGTLWIATDDEEKSVYAVDTHTGDVRAIGSMGHAPGEGEGIDVTALPSGLVHTIEVDANLVSTWFQHWGAAGAPAATIAGAGEVCLVDEDTGLGLPFLPLDVRRIGAASFRVTTRHDGCAAVAGLRRDDVVSFAGSMGALRSGDRGRDVAVDDDTAIVPLARAHAHNDYEHERPLFDALARGFTSVEADVWLVGGELLIGHDGTDVRPGRTLQSLYLDPLARQVRLHGGSVYEDWPKTFHLLIDVKTEAETTYAAVHEALAGYADTFTTFGPDGVIGGAVTATISGNRARATMEGQTVRYAGYDGRLADLGDGSRASFMPLISESWSTAFTWNGEGAMPQAERQQLRGVVSRAHANGQRVRFWATPDDAGHRGPVWRELLAAGVDLINTDDLDGLREWLAANDPARSTPAVAWWPPER